MSTANPIRLRRPTLVSAPLFIIGLMGSSFAIALGLWAGWHQVELGAPFWIPFAITSFIGVGGFAAGRGCFVEIRHDEVIDVVGWVKLQRIPRPSISSIRVRSGFWRFYELTLENGSIRVLLGATPAQFPSRLLPGAEQQDLSDIELILDE